MKYKELGYRLSSPTFPNLQTLGYYSSLEQYIKLNKIRKEDLQDMQKNPNDYSTAEKLELVAHELKHWMDHISTVWGQNSIVKTYNALSIRHNNKIDLFNQIVDFVRESKQESFSNYFNTVESTDKIAVKSQRWKCTYTVGCRFNSDGYVDYEKPIPFISFHSLDNSRIARVPISISTLLETNAVAEELIIRGNYLSTLDEMTKLVENKSFENDFLIGRLYNPSLTLYSAAVHILSNMFQISDAMIGYKLSAQVATLCLNMPQKYFPIVHIPEEYAKVLGERGISLLKNKDRGFLYFILVANYANEYKTTQQLDIDVLLSKSNLPKSEIISEEVLLEFDEISSKLIESQFSSRAKKLLSIGKHMFLERGLFGEKIKSSIDILKNKSYIPIIISDSRY